MNHKNKISSTSVNHKNKICSTSVNHKNKTCSTSVNHKNKICSTSVNHKNKICSTSVNHKNKTRSTSVNHKNKTCSTSVNHKNKTRSTSVNHKNKTCSTSVLSALLHLFRESYGHPARSPLNKKFVYFLQSPYLFTIDRLFPSIVEMFRINFYRISLNFSFRHTKLIVVYVIERTPIRNVHSQ